MLEGETIRRDLDALRRGIAHAANVPLDATSSLSLPALRALAVTEGGGFDRQLDYFLGGLDEATRAALDEALDDCEVTPESVTLEAIAYGHRTVAAIWGYLNASGREVVTREEIRDGLRALGRTCPEE